MHFSPLTPSPPHHHHHPNSPPPPRAALPEPQNRRRPPQNHPQPRRQVLANDVTFGYEEVLNTQVVGLNGAKVGNMRELAALVDACTGVLDFDLARAPPPPPASAAAVARSASRRWRPRRSAPRHPLPSAGHCS